MNRYREYRFHTPPPPPAIAKTMHHIVVIAMGVALGLAAAIYLYILINDALYNWRAAQSAAKLDSVLTRRLNACANGDDKECQAFSDNLAHARASACAIDQHIERCTRYDEYLDFYQLITRGRKSSSRSMQLHPPFAQGQALSGDSTGEDYMRSMNFERSAWGTLAAKAIVVQDGPRRDRLSAEIVICLDQMMTPTGRDNESAMTMRQWKLAEVTRACAMAINERRNDPPG